MEVPRRPQPSVFTLQLHTPASSCLEEVNPRRTEAQQQQQQGEEVVDEEEEDRDPEAEPPVPVIMEPPELEVTDALFSVSLEDKRRSEEEAMARERAAQRQQLAMEELVQSERNYLRLLQLTTITIRSNLQKLQVLTQRRGQWNSRCGSY